MTASVRRRFAFTVGANLLRGLISLSTGMLLARWLGPASYGNMAFLTGTFVAIRQLLDLGSSSAFFTFLSQRPRSKSFVSSYFAWLAAQFLIALVLIGILFPAAWIAAIWRGEQRSLVLLAFAAVFLQNSVWPVVQQAGESQRETVWVQGLGVAVVGAHLAAVFLFWRLGILGLHAIFAAIAFEYLLAAVVAQHSYAYSSPRGGNEGEDPRESIFKKYLSYCLPLVAYSCVGFAYEFADRWLLQKYGGRIEQAYYAVGAQFASIGLIATTSILRIFWKEIAESYHQGNLERTRILYRKVSRLTFLVGAMVAGFVIPWTQDLLRLIVGPAYVQGALTMAIMFFYPVHQSMGQITGTMLYATERVSLLVLTGTVFMMISMGVTYFVLAPGNAVVPGLGLAAEGLAIKMVVMQLIQVNIVAYLIARLYRWRFDWIYQAAGLSACLGLGWLAHAAVCHVAGGLWPLPVLMGLGGLLYAAAMAAVVYAMPWLAGLTREELLLDLAGGCEGIAAWF